MSERIWIAVDAMGGDNACAAPVAGALRAAAEDTALGILLVGREEEILRELDGKDWDRDRISIVPASEVIGMSEAPVAAIRHKKDSSIVVGQKLLRDGRADAFVSAGSTGAILVGGQLIVGRIKGVERAPIGTIIPTTEGVSLLLDSGANVDSRSTHLVQYALMGSVYMEHSLKIASPSVALVNVGEEEEKGNALVKETYPLLKELPGIRFIGSIEARDIPFGKADVIVADAFVGNVILKMYEGAAAALVGQIKAAMLSTFRSKIGAALVKPALKETLKKMDASAYGGAPLLGLKKLVVKVHGGAKEKEIGNAVLQCRTFAEQKIAEKIEAAMEGMEDYGNRQDPSADC